MTHDQTETLLDLLTDIKVQIGDMVFISADIAKSLEKLSTTKKETADANTL